MYKQLCLILATAFSLAGGPQALASNWGGDYFPNVPLRTHDGETVRFFDDLIEDKIVAVNFIYTSCPDTCPLETAQLVRAQHILGDRLGSDIFFYSITIDPENDTPEVLREYRERFGAKWTFLTGEESDITLLRRKLGLYIEEIQDGSLNHNVSMIIGNQATGRWMKRSPFENPHVLADQIANWLTDWKAPPNGKDYAHAPELRTIPRGEQIFRTRCAACHTIAGFEPEDALGPDLFGVTQRREKSWLISWLRAPDKMLEEKDPIALALYEKYDRLAMPNSRLNQNEVLALLHYIEGETARLMAGLEGHSHDAHSHDAHSHNGHSPGATAVSHSQPVESHGHPAEDAVAIMNAWVRATDSRAKMNAGYMTLVNVNGEDLRLARIESAAFKMIEVHEMAMVDGLMKMRELTDVVIPAHGQLRLEPGGKHLMLMGPREHFTAGETLDMTLVFESGRRQTVPISVLDK